MQEELTPPVCGLTIHDDPFGGSSPAVQVSCPLGPLGGPDTHKGATDPEGQLPGAVYPGFPQLSGLSPASALWTSLPVYQHTGKRAGRREEMVPGTKSSQGEAREGALCGP